MYSQVTLVAVTLGLFLKTTLADYRPGTLYLNEAVHLIEAGKSQYKTMIEKSMLPEYGICWKNAVIHLQEGCKSLTERSQSDIALQFTDCFLTMSGHKPTGCRNKEMSTATHCLQEMSDREFNAYTEFYTHTQNICFFLQNQIWHEQTEDTINKLTHSSARVTEQLQEAEDLQANILDQQRQSMSIQMEVLSNGLSLGKMFDESQASLHLIMQEFQNSTLEQKKIVFDIFHRLSILQTWAVGQVSWLDTVVFYVASVIVAYIVTAMPRTHGARLPIFLALSGNLVVERIICAVLFEDDMDRFVQHLNWWVWLFRRMMVTSCAVLVAVAAYHYCDYNVANHRLLREIISQNKRLVKFLEKNHLTLESFPAKTPPKSVHSSPLSPADGQGGGQVASISSLSKTSPHSGVSTSFVFDQRNAVQIVRVHELQEHKRPSPAPSVASSATGSHRSVRNQDDDFITPARYNLRSRGTPISDPWSV